MLDTNNLKSERTKLCEQMAALNETAKKDQRDFTDAERETWENWEREVRRLDGQIARDEAALQRGFLYYGGRQTENGRQAENGRSADGDLIPIESRGLSANESFRDYMVRSHNVEPIRDVSFADFIRAKITGKPRTAAEKRALNESGDAAGGVYVPDYLSSQFIDRLRAAMWTVKFGAKTMAVQSDNLSFARVASDPSPAWRAEEGAVSESDPVSSV
jgi:HK97 family phage major capsid protein